MAFATSLSIERTSWIILLLLSVILLLVEGSSGEGTVASTGEVEEGGEMGEAIDEEGHESHPYYAVLFPSFILTLGVVVYYILSRYLHFLPYTAIMFLLGTIMGIISEYHILDYSGKEYAYMDGTLAAWRNINSEVLLLVFLPGLIFKDALGQNPYLFTMGFGQLLIFAFPLVVSFRVENRSLYIIMSIYISKLTHFYFISITASWNGINGMYWLLHFPVRLVVPSLFGIWKYPIRYGSRGCSCAFRRSRYVWQKNNTQVVLYCIVCVCVCVCSGSLNESKSQ
jgi:hypothetical protein